MQYHRCPIRMLELFQRSSELLSRQVLLRLAEIALVILTLTLLLYHLRGPIVEPTLGAVVRIGCTWPCTAHEYLHIALWCRAMRESRRTTASTLSEHLRRWLWFTLFQLPSSRMSHVC
jgi:hypothetical protein